MTLREYMLKTAAVDQLIRVNALIQDVSGGYCLVDAIEKAADSSAYPSRDCGGDCNRCMADLLNKEVHHGK